MSGKKIREAGTPALLCFEPEEQPTGCRITSFINMIIASMYFLYIKFLVLDLDYFTLHIDDRTIWCVYDKAKKKRGRENE